MDDDATALRPVMGAGDHPLPGARHASALWPVIGAGERPIPLDVRVATLAAAQHGVVSRSQLALLGLSRRAMGHRLECGRLHLVHRGVFAVGHTVLSREGRWMAAVLAAGDDAVLSHRAAAALWGIRPGSARAAEVSVPRKLRSRPRLEVHFATLPADEITTLHGIAVTTSSRTLLDLAAVVRAHELEKAVDQAEVLRLADSVSLAELVARHPCRAGVVALRSLLEAGRIGASITRSELEDRYRAFLDASGLPRPAFNVQLEIAGGWIEADCVWRPQRVVVELDGYASHGTRAAFERDRSRDRRLQVAGWRVLRVTWRQLQGGSARLAEELHTLLGPRRGIPSDAA